MKDEENAHHGLVVDFVVSLIHLDDHQVFSITERERETFRG